MTTQMVRAGSRQTTTKPLNSNTTDLSTGRLAWRVMLEQLRDTVEALRAVEYADLDSELVAEILMIEAEHLSLRAGVLTRLEQAVDSFLDTAEVQ